MYSPAPTRYQRFLVAFLYFVQGVFLVIPGTIILTYKQIPDYSILALFSFAVLPFSFKFIAAPLIEKYTVASYGRRKTWVVLSLVLASLALVLCTFFTQEEPGQQRFLAIFLTAAILMVALEDISTDALAVKELNSAEMASFMQCVMQPIGAVIGSLFFLELVSGSLYIKLGFESPFLTVNQYLLCLSALTLFSAIIIHLTYTEKVTDEERQAVKYSLWEVIKEYRYFVNPKYRLCRQCITFLIQSHGLIYFSSSFTVELIKSNVISKDALTTLSNFLVIPVFFLTSVLRRHWSAKQKIHSRTQSIGLIRLALMIFLFLASINSAPALYIFIMVLSMLSNAQFFLNSMLCNDFTESKFAGMYVTMMASFTNFGNNSTIQLQAISLVGIEKATIFGFIFAAIVLLSFKWIQKWIKNGIEQESNQYSRVEVKQS